MNIRTFIGSKIEKIQIFSRIILLKTRGSQIGSKVKIYGRIVVNRSQNLIINDFSTINEGVIINARAKVYIGKYCRISSGVIINSGGLNLDESYTHRKHFSKAVIIEDGVWLGSGCQILPGIRICEGSVIAAGTIVTKNVPKFSLVVGNPGRILRKIK